MERDWIASPKDIEVGTQYGPVYISCNGGENDAVYVDAQHNGRTVTFAGNQYAMAFYLQRRDGEWGLFNAGWAVSGHAPPSYKKKITAEVIRAVGTYLDLHPQLVLEGRRAEANNNLARLERDIAKLEAELAAKNAEAAALAAQLALVEQQAALSHGTTARETHATAPACA